MKVKRNKKGQQHRAKYIHEETCLVHDTGGGVCDCRRVLSPRWLLVEVLTTTSVGRSR